jgi:hypothetical protein
MTTGASAAAPLSAMGGAIESSEQAAEDGSAESKTGMCAFDSAGAIEETDSIDSSESIAETDAAESGESLTDTAAAPASGSVGNSDSDMKDAPIGSGEALEKRESLPQNNGDASDAAAAPEDVSEASETVAEGARNIVASIYDAVVQAVQPPELFAAPDSIIADYYGISESDYEDAVFMMSVDSLLADEIVIILAAGLDAAEKTRDLLGKRLKNKADEARGYSPEQFAVIEKCVATRDGRLVAMLVSPKADIMRDAYYKTIKQFNVSE